MTQQKRSKFVSVDLDTLDQVTGGCVACGNPGLVHNKQRQQLSGLDPRDPRLAQMLGRGQRQALG